MTEENKVFPFETPSDPPSHGRGSNGGNAQASLENRRLLRVLRPRSLGEEDDRGEQGFPVRERLASLEAKMDHAATREDVLAIKVSIERIEARLEHGVEARMEHVATKEDIQRLKVWVLGGVLGALGLAVVVATGVVTLFT